MEEITIPSHEQIKTTWNKFSNFYGKHIAPHFIAKGLCMTKLLKIEEADSILEVACGDGRLCLEIALKKREDCKLIVTDISDVMCRITQKKLTALSELLEKPRGILNFEKKLENIFTEESDPEFKGQEVVENLKTTICLANNEDLRQIVEDSSIEVYIASLSLHITTNPENMLSEAFRVLKPGGRAIFSVWGDIDASLFFTAKIKAMQDVGFVVSKKSRTLFHMNNEVESRERLKLAGFVDVKSWQTFIPFKSMGEDELYQFCYEIIHNDMDGQPEFHELVAKRMAAIFQECYDKETTFGFNALMLWGRKL